MCANGACGGAGIGACIVVRSSVNPVWSLRRTTVCDGLSVEPYMSVLPMCAIDTAGVKNSVQCYEYTYILLLYMHTSRETGRDGKPFSCQIVTVSST